MPFSTRGETAKKIEIEDLAGRLEARVGWRAARKRGGGIQQRYCVENPEGLEDEAEARLDVGDEQDDEEQSDQGEAPRDVHGLQSDAAQHERDDAEAGEEAG